MVMFNWFICMDILIMFVCKLIMFIRFICMDIIIMFVWIEI
jgi:hypothetical protein